jgi:glutamate dehydrogenase
METVFSRFAPAVATLRARLSADTTPGVRAQQWIAAGVPPDLAREVDRFEGLYPALDVTEVAEACQRKLEEVAEVHVAVGERLGLSRLRAQIDALRSDSHWQGLAKAALGDDLADLQRAITLEAVTHGSGDTTQMLTAWAERNGPALERTQRLLAELAEVKGADLAMLSVALRDLRSLA